jgi:hypothetical protein
MLKKLRPVRPSPAMLVALVALVAATTGPAIADQAAEFAKGKKINGSRLKARSVSGSKLKRNTVTGTQIAESKLGKVPAATKADTATSANTANTANSANTALSAKSADTATVGGPLGFARVDSTGNVVEADSRNVTDANVSLQSTSAYCFVGLPFAFKTAVTTVDYSDPVTGGLSSDITAQVGLGDPFGDCSVPGTQLEVATLINSAFAPAGFFIVFH